MYIYKAFLISQEKNKIKTKKKQKQCMNHWRRKEIDIRWYKIIFYAVFSLKVCSVVFKLDGWKNIWFTNLEKKVSLLQLWKWLRGY